METDTNGWYCSECREEEGYGCQTFYVKYFTSSSKEG